MRYIDYLLVGLTARPNLLTNPEETEYVRVLNPKNIYIHFISTTHSSFKTAGHFISCIYNGACCTQTLKQPLFMSFELFQHLHEEPDKNLIPSKLTESRWPSHTWCERVHKTFQRFFANFSFWFLQLTFFLVLSLQEKVVWAQHFQSSFFCSQHFLWYLDFFSGSWSSLITEPGWLHLCSSSMFPIFFSTKERTFLVSTFLPVVISCKYNM